MTMTIEVLNEKIDGLKGLLEAHQTRQDEQFVNLEKYLTLKINSDNCVGVFCCPKIRKT